MPLLRAFSDRRPKGSFPSVDDKPVIPGMDPDITRSTRRRKRADGSNNLGAKLSMMKNRFRKSSDSPMSAQERNGERKAWGLTDWARRKTSGSDSGSTHDNSDELPLMTSGSMDSSLNFGLLGGLV